MTQNTDSKTIELPGDPETATAQDIPFATEMQEMSQTIADQAREIERLTAMQPDYLKACLDEGIKENARLLKLAVWAAKESGEYCPDCEERARSEFDYCWEGPGKPDIDIIDDALEYDGFLEQASEYCDRPNCAGGWKAYVPDGETIKRGDQSYTQPVYVPIAKRGDA